METPNTDWIDKLPAAVQQYYRSSLLALPVKHPRGFSLDGYHIFCGLCAAETVETRGETTVSPACIEIEAGGHCLKCRAITYSKSRWYEGHVLHRTNHGWVRLETRHPFWTRVRLFFGRMLFVIPKP